MRSFFTISDWSGNQPNSLDATVVMTTNVHAAPTEDSLIDYFNDQLSNRLIELGVSDTILDLFDIANFTSSLKYHPVHLPTKLYILPLILCGNNG